MSANPARGQRVQHGVTLTRTPVSGALAAISLTSMALFLAGGCESGGAGIAERTYRGLPDNVPAHQVLGRHGPEDGPIAVLVTEDRLALTLWGSSSCPTVPTGSDIVDRHTVRISVRTIGGPQCTADLAPTTSEIALDPAEVDTASSLGVTVVYTERTPTRLTVPPAAPPG